MNDPRMVIYRISDRYYREELGRLIPVRLASDDETTALLDRILGDKLHRDEPPLEYSQKVDLKEH